jgi:precorrin-2/cobalt-factor-2 C20-methyltransferase
VVFLCEGDPLFFGSFAYLLIRLEADYACAVVPGISSVNASSAALCLPLTVLSESFAVISGRHGEAQLVDVLNTHDSVVIMKAGRARPRILSALVSTGRTGDARYLEYIGRDNEMIETDVARLAPEAGPYFSIFVVTRNQRDIR